MKLKKSLLCAILVVGFAGLSHGAVAINWTSGAFNVLTDHLGANLLTSYIFAGYLSPDASTSGFDPSPTGWDNPTGGDSFLGYWEIGPFAGTIFNVSSTGTNDAVGWGVGEYVYVVGFETTTNVAASGTIPAGTYYGISPVSTTTTTEYNTDPAPRPVPQPIGTELQPFQTSLQVVPEPGTVSLVLLGMGVLAGRSLRRRKK